MPSLPWPGGIVTDKVVQGRQGCTILSVVSSTHWFWPEICGLGGLEAIEVSSHSRVWGVLPSPCPDEVLLTN